MKMTIGEEQITPQIMQYVVPDVVSPQGQQDLQQRLQNAHSIKPHMDSVLKQVAQQTGASFSSRIKDADVAIKKTAQKRLQGRPYKLDDINDWYGGRLSVEHPSQIDKVKKALIKAGIAGNFKILKSQEIIDPDSEYKAHHFDVKKDGTRGEIQIMTMHNLARAAASHDQHALFGESLPPEQKKVVQAQNDVLNQLPPIKAKQVGDDLVQLHKQAGDKPLPPGVIPKQIINSISS